MYFFCSGRKFCLASSVYNMYFCTKSECCSCCIHCNITATDNGNFLACCDRCIIIFTECFHQVASCQILICREDFICILSRNTHTHRKTGSWTDKYCLKSLFFHQLVDRSGFTDHNIRLKFDTKLFYLLDLFCNNFLLWKTELRDTIYKYSSEFMQSFKYSYIIT